MTLRAAAAAAAAVAVAVAVLLLAIGGAPAHAQSASPPRILDAFERDGTIAICVYSEQDLAAARDAATADPDRYGASFAGAVQAALDAQVRGDCDAAPAAEDAGAAPAPAAAGTPAPTPAGGAPTPAPAAVPTPPATAPAADSPGDGVPAAAWMLAAAALLLALSALASILVSRNRSGDEPLASVAHAWREARHRAGGVWLDFADWLRLGR